MNSRQARHVNHEAYLISNAYKNFVSNLNHLAAAKFGKFYLAALEKEIGLAPSSLHRLFHGKVSCTIPTLCRIQAAIGCSFDAFFTFIGDMPVHQPATEPYKPRPVISEPIPEAQTSTESLPTGK